MSNYPARFGKYVLLERVNTGGMAEVFKAKATSSNGFGRILAIKRILPNLVEDDEFIRMFIDEARIAVQLNHENIIQIYELGKHADHYYIAMEYIASRDLRAILDKMRAAGQLMPIAQAAFITRKVCDGLDYAHRKRDASGAAMNIIHRDVSPQNILVGFDGEVKVIDFGIAKAANRSSKTQAGVLKGKFGYMSPEQVRGLPTDRRSDIFAVGVLLYEMLTGERLFIGESDFSTLEKVRNAEVIPPTHFNKKISPQLEQVVLRALAREVEDRHQWASDMSAELEPFTVESKQQYTSKRLASMMRDTYAAEVELERRKNEAFLDNSVDGSSASRGRPGHAPAHAHGQAHAPSGGQAHGGGAPRAVARAESADAVTAGIRGQRRPPPSEIDDDEGYEVTGEDKTFVIEASVAGLALQRDVTEDAGGESRAPSEADGIDDDDDARTLVGSENPFHEGENGARKNLTGEDDEIDASETGDSIPSGPPSARGRLPLADPGAATMRGPASPGPGAASSPRALNLAVGQVAPAAPARKQGRSIDDEDALARQIVKGVVSGRPGAVPAGPGPGPGPVPFIPGFSPMPGFSPSSAAPGDGRSAIDGAAAHTSWNSTQNGSSIGDTRAEHASNGAHQEQSLLAALAPSTIPPRLVRILMVAAVVSVGFFLMMTAVLATRLAGVQTSLVEFYIVGDVQAPPDLTVAMDDVTVGPFGQRYKVVGEATVRIAGTGVRPVTRVVRATGSPMRQPVLLTAVDAPPSSGATDTPPQGDAAPTDGTASPPVAAVQGVNAAEGAWRLSLATIDNDSGRPLTGAEVFVDGVLVGRTPVEAELNPGAERITLRVKLDGYMTREVALTRGGRSTVGPGTIRLAAGPDLRASAASGAGDAPAVDAAPGSDGTAGGSPDGAREAQMPNEDIAARRPGTTTDKQPDAPGEKVVDKPTETPTDKLVDKATDKAPDKPVDKASKVSERSADRAPDKGDKKPTLRASSSLQIGTRPAAEAYVDGRLVGTTPFYSDNALKVPVGKRRLEFVVKGTGKRHRYEVVVEAAAPDNKLVIDFSKPSQPKTMGQVTAKFLQ